MKHIVVPPRVVRRKIPIELDMALRKLQSDLKFQVGIDVTLVNAGRAMSKLADRDIKILKVSPIRSKKKNERYKQVQFEV